MMRYFRKTLINERPFESFQLYCSECNNMLIETNDLTDSPFKDEILVLHIIESHVRKTGHHSFDAAIEPAHVLQNIDATITVTEDLK